MVVSPGPEVLVTARDFLGELEEMVLMAALRLRDGAYGAAILRELDERAGRDVPRGSVYVTLERLESKGLVESREGEPTPGRGGRPRRMVAVTGGGVEALRRTHEVRERLRDGLGEVLGG
jgi:DNA-binding PadR family transcriptional regulator